MIVKSNNKLYIDLRFCVYVTKEEAKERVTASSEITMNARKYLDTAPMLCEEGAARMRRRNEAWKFFEAYFVMPNVKHLVTDIHADYCRVVKDIPMQSFKPVLRAYIADSGVSIRLSNRKARQKAIRLE